MKSFQLLSALLVTALPLSAATFTLDSAVRHALAENRDLAAARLRIVEAGARREQSGRLSNPELETEVRPNTNGREGVLALGVIQRFPLTARLRLERAVSQAELTAATAEVHTAERALAAQVAFGVADWLAFTAQRQVREQQRAHGDELAQAARAAGQRGEGSDLEAQQLELEAAQLKPLIRQLERERASVAAALRPILGVAASEPLEFAGALPHSVPSTGETPGEPPPRPDQQWALAQTETARRVAELTRAQRWQDVGVGLVSELQRSEDRPGGRQSDQFVGLQFSLPLPFWNRNQGRIREAAVVLERRQLEQAALDLKIQTEQVAAREQLAAASSAEREVAETLLPAARRIEEQLLRLRDQGQATFVELARVREKRLQLEVSHIEARRDVLRAYLQLQFALGQVPHFSPAP